MIGKRRIKRHQPIKRKKTIFQYPVFWLTLAFVLLGSGLFYLICFASIVQIKNIRVEKEVIAISPGIDLISNQTIQNINTLIEEEITKKIFSQEIKSILLVNNQKITKEITDQFPEISQIDIEKKYSQGVINFYLSRKRGLALWCQEMNCFLLDKLGIIFSQPSEIDQKLFRITRPNDQEELILGTTIIDVQKLTQILDIFSTINKTEDLKLIIKSFEIESNEKLNIITDENWRIYLNPKENVDWQLTKLEASLKEIPLENRKNLEYIELRFNNFAPYKYR
ncbi:cell division protein FtsQ/DivIB [Patescibacteria group bacterium]|nr:cell division protein FtsQ/DivIB [Patescibacteria group bacterium]MBU1877307.1 cell division protein FtsQ/DivIB [Patescibacteria group bacterium]